MLKPSAILRLVTALAPLFVTASLAGAPDTGTQELANRANLAMAEEDWETADQLLEEALERTDDAPELWIGRGFTRKQLERIEDARESFEKALELYLERAGEDPDNPGLVMNVGYTLVLLNRRDDAVAYLEDAAERNPEEPMFQRFEQIIDGLEENFGEYILPEKDDDGAGEP